MKEMLEKDDITTIHRYLAGELNPEELSRFESRLAQEPDLAGLCTELRQIWEVSAEYSSPVFSNQPALTLFQSNIRKQAARQRLMRRMYAAAAVVIALIGFWALVLGKTEYKTFYAQEPTHHGLPDGSAIEMREGARMIVPGKFNNRERRVEIVHGEVFFTIASDDSRPFVIKNAWAQVLVTGTEFVISVDSSTMTYTLKVTEGEVEFTPELSKRTIPVTAGSGIRFHADSRVVDRIAGVDENAVSWSTGELVFRNTRLDKVILDLESHYHVSLTLMSPQLRSCTFTAPLAYRDVPLSTILDALSTGLGMSVEKNGEASYTLKGGRCR